MTFWYAAEPMEADPLAIGSWAEGNTNGTMPRSNIITLAKPDLPDQQEERKEKSNSGMQREENFNFCFLNP